jgi:co-chaperonin GroES (HSP10)
MEEMMLKAVGERVILAPETVKNRTAGKSGAIITVESPRPLEGKVISIGDLKKSKIKLGDIVFFAKDAELEVEYQGQKYYILDIKDILAIK